MYFKIWAIAMSLLFVVCAFFGFRTGHNSDSFTDYVEKARVETGLDCNPTYYHIVTPSPGGPNKEVLVLLGHVYPYDKNMNYEVHHEADDIVATIDHKEVARRLDSCSKSYRGEKADLRLQ